MIKLSHFLHVSVSHVCDTFLNISVLGTTDRPELIYFNTKLLLKCCKDDMTEKHTFTTEGLMGCVGWSQGPLKGKQS